MHSSAAALHPRGAPFAWFGWTHESSHETRWVPHETVVGSLHHRSCASDSGHTSTRRKRPTTTRRSERARTQEHSEPVGAAVRWRNRFASFASCRTNAARRTFPTWCAHACALRRRGSVSFDVAARTISLAWMRFYSFEFRRTAGSSLGEHDVR